MPITRDQQRASLAYSQVVEITDKDARENYKIAVKSLGATILRSGLSAAFADLMRRKDKTKELRGHLAESRIPGLEGTIADNLCQKVNSLKVGDYMIATRETLQVVTWLKRACEAIFDDPPSEKLESDSASAGGGRRA